ncbi:MAG: DNA mismatch repair protein MutS, partial [Candidatus Zixiibacteriota bacterium]
FDPQSGAEEMRRFFDVTSLEGFGVSESDMSVGAAAAIVRYLKDNQRQNLGHITRLSAIKAGEFMELDQSSARNLELVESLSKTDGPSLFAAVNRTLTSPGARRLRRNLLAPFCKRDTILRRQSAIDDTLHRPDSARATQELLRRLPDLERLVGKLGTLRISPRQTRALARALETGYDIIVSIDASSSELFTGFVARYPGELKEAGKRLAERLVEEPPLVSSGGGIFRPGASAELDSLNGSISSARSYLATLQQQEREATGIPSLKLGFNKIFGYYLEVTNTHKDKIPERYLRKQTLVNAERYITEEMKEQERLIQQAEERIFSLEKELFEQALEELSTHICDIQLATDMLAEIDVVTALAELARERGYCRPTITEAGELRITAGRHPVIETILPRGSFVPNDIELDNSTQRLMILTGPNMAGKSTYLRQIGHIVVLAQIGSYVPAESATIGLVDRIFTRVGAVDKLAQGQSTFMVEMLETANILNNGDENSLILLDEVGRGTSTFDGLSLAWAIVEEIDERLKARTVFATHYHELTALAAERNHVVNYQVAVKRWSDRIIFLHRIVPGGCDDSYGIEVSRLAGLPNNVVARAGEILKMMESGQLISSRTHSGLSADRQTSLFDRSSGAETPVDTALNEIADRLREMRTEEMTPLEALTELDSLSKRIKGD